MKRFFYAMLIAATAMFASCAPETTEGPNTDDPYKDRPLNNVKVFNMGDMEKDGNTHFIVQISHLNIETNSFTRMISSHFVAEGTVDTKSVPEGTFDLLEGDYVDQGFFKGSFYMELSDDQTDIYYHIFDEGSINITKTSKGYQFAVAGECWDWNTGDSVSADYKYEGTVFSIENTRRYNPDFAAAVFFGTDQNGVPYWNLQLDDHEKYILWFYINTFDASEEAFVKGIDSFFYEINATGAIGAVESSYPLAPGEYGGSLVYRVNNEGNLDPENLMLGGYVDVKKVGEVSDEKTTAEGVVYRTCDYEIDVMFYNQSYVPYFVTYTGEIKLHDMSAPVEYEKFARIEYYGSNKYLVKVLDGEADMCTQFYTFGPDGSTAEGLADGTYTVTEYENPFNQVENGTPYTILAGISYTNENDKLMIKGYTSYFSPANIEGKGVIDTVESGTMTVTNNGAEGYIIDIKNCNGIFYAMVDFSYTYEGEVEMVDYSAYPLVAPAKAAGFDAEPLFDGFAPKAMRP